MYCYPNCSPSLPIPPVLRRRVSIFPMTSVSLVVLLVHVTLPEVEPYKLLYSSVTSTLQHSFVLSPCFTPTSPLVPSRVRLEYPVRVLRPKVRFPLPLGNYSDLDPLLYWTNCINFQVRTMSHLLRYLPSFLLSLFH